MENVNFDRNNTDNSCNTICNAYKKREYLDNSDNYTWSTRYCIGII